MPSARLGHGSTPTPAPPHARPGRRLVRGDGQSLPTGSHRRAGAARRRHGARVGYQRPRRARRRRQSSHAALYGDRCHRLRPVGGLARSLLTAQRPGPDVRRLGVRLGQRPATARRWTGTHRSRWPESPARRRSARGRAPPGSAARAARQAGRGAAGIASRRARVTSTLPLDGSAAGHGRRPAPVPGRGRSGCSTAAHPRPCSSRRPSCRPAGHARRPRGVPGGGGLPWPGPGGPARRAGPRRPQRSQRRAGRQRAGVAGRTCLHSRTWLIRREVPEPTPVVTGDDPDGARPQDGPRCPTWSFPYAAPHGMAAADRRRPRPRPGPGGGRPQVPLVPPDAALPALTGLQHAVLLGDSGSGVSSELAGTPGRSSTSTSTSTCCASRSASGCCSTPGPGRSRRHRPGEHDLPRRRGRRRLRGPDNRRQPALGPGDAWPPWTQLPGPCGPSVDPAAP